MMFLSDEMRLKVEFGQMATSGGARDVYLSGRIGGVRLKGKGFY